MTLPDQNDAATATDQSKDKCSSVQNPPLVYQEAIGRYQKICDAEVAYKTALATAQMTLDDHADAEVSLHLGSVAQTSEVRNNLVQSALGLQVLLKNFPQFLSSVPSDVSNLLPAHMSEFNGTTFSNAVEEIYNEFSPVRKDLDVLLSAQRVHESSQNYVKLPAALEQGLTLLCNHVSTGERQSTGTTSTSPAWAMYYKKAIPKFSGSFDSWLEWSTLMERDILPLYKDLPELAVTILRESVDACPQAKALIASVDSSSPDPSTKIMSLLKGYYGSKSTLGFYYASELKNLKSVSEGDYKGFNDFILKLDNIVTKIVKNGLESYVSPTEIFSLQNCLPPSRREGWTDIYGDLTATDTAHPIGKFRDYCVKLQPAVQKMSVDRGLMDGNKTQAKSRFVQSSQDSDCGSYAQSSCATYFCVFHESGNHDSNNCKRFLGLTPKERSRLCTQFDICKVCLQAGHKAKTCTDSSLCKHCQRSGHHTLLCFLGDVNKNDAPKNQREMLGNRDGKNSRNVKQKSAINPGNSAFSSEAGANKTLDSSAPQMPFTQMPFYPPPYPYGFPPFFNPYASQLGQSHASSAFSTNTAGSSGQNMEGRVGQGSPMGATPQSSANVTQTSQPNNGLVLRLVLNPRLPFLVPLVPLLVLLVPLVPFLVILLVVFLFVRNHPLLWLLSAILTQVPWKIMPVMLGSLGQVLTFCPLS